MSLENKKPPENTSENTIIQPKSKEAEFADWLKESPKEAAALGAVTAGALWLFKVWLPFGRSEKDNDLINEKGGLGAAIEKTKQIYGTIRSVQDAIEGSVDIDDLMKRNPKEPKKDTGGESSSIPSSAV